MQIPANEIVPGDIARVEAGDRIPGDGRLVEGHGVMADESILTGESLPIEKNMQDELFSGTLRDEPDVTDGNGSRPVRS